MRHFIAYHKADERGLIDRDQRVKVRTIGSKKSLAALQSAIGHRVWLVEGRGTTTGRRTYSLAHCFVSETVEDATTGEERTLTGSSVRYFDERPLDRQPWFQSLKSEVANFSVGFQEVKRPEVIAALDALMEAAPKPLKRFRRSGDIPEGITREHVLAAIADTRRGIEHTFRPSTTYDLVHEGHRYPPMAVMGLAAQRLTGTELGPYDFKGGRKTKCFRILRGLGFTIAKKGAGSHYPDEVDEDELHTEGAVSRVTVNRYERDPRARAKCVKHFGARCQVCSFDFAARFGVLGEGFIHVHHVVPLGSIRRGYRVDPVKDLRPVCPNCHAMLHRQSPPLGIDELRQRLS